MNAHIIVVAYGLADDLLTLYYSANGPGLHWHIFLHSKFAPVVAACYGLASNVNVTLYPYMKNRGLACSWNEGLLTAYEQGAEFALIANDDAIASYSDVREIVAAARQHPDAYMVSGWGRDLRDGRDGDMLFSMAAVTPTAMDAIGCFDENFFPIYYEDIDFYRRAALAGLLHVTVKTTNILHAGSKSLYAVPGAQAQHERTFQRNKAYYGYKWGCTEHGSETFAMPFNDPRFSVKIEPEARHAPYPEYNRTDQEVVTL